MLHHDPKVPEGRRGGGERPPRRGRRHRATAGVALALVVGLLGAPVGPVAAAPTDHPSEHSMDPIDPTYPFVCTTAREGLGQPKIDNQDGQGIPVAEDRITMSSDGNGVMTVTDPATGKHRPLIAPVRSLFEEFVQMVREGIPLETALRIVSTNAADHLRLSGKRRIMEDADADILLLHEDDFSLSSVIARGEIVFEKGSVTKRGLFEEE